MANLEAREEAREDEVILQSLLRCCMKVKQEVQ